MTHKLARVAAAAALVFAATALEAQVGKSVISGRSPVSLMRS
jgi:hypothetical protein